MPAKQKSALISVYNKEGIVPFAKELVALGWKIYSSGGTAKALTAGGVETTDVAELVGGEAILGHRVVTLSREVHAGLLARHDNDTDIQEMEDLGIPFIDLLCNDLYPLKEEIAKPDSTMDSVIQQTDIGGPTMLRSAAKGGRIVICNAEDRNRVIEWLKSGEPEREQFTQELRAKSEAYVADYVLASAKYHGYGKYDGFVGERILECKYGENGYQTPAALYSTHTTDPLALDKFEVVLGTAPSYNNLCDVDRLVQTMTHIVAGQKANQLFSSKIFVAVAAKHGNSCGASISADPAEVTKKALEGDLRAVFGGLVILNFEVDDKIAEILLTHEMPEGRRRLLDGIMAPGFTEKAIESLQRKGDKCRLLANAALATLGVDSLDNSQRFRYVRGGFLTQPNYTYIPRLTNADITKGKNEEKNNHSDMLLAWAIGSTSNSNTVTIVKNGMLIGNGVGQQDRVGGAKLAVMRATDAGHDTVGAIAYSDSFFPFTDGVETLSSAGIQAIFATSGSVRDPEVKDFCKKNGVTLYLVPDSEARGFFGH